VISSRTRAYLRVKARGDSSMLLKAEGEGRDVHHRSASPVRMVRLCLSNPSSSGEPHTRRSISEAATLEYTCDVCAGGKLSPVRNQQ